jgi:hypothetical protein
MGRDEHWMGGRSTGLRGGALEEKGRALDGRGKYCMDVRIGGIDGGGGGGGESVGY